MRAKVWQGITYLAITWYTECHSSLTIQRHSITRSKKVMVTLPASSLDCGTWKTKHLARTTITSVCVMDNNVGNMEIQQAVDHIPGVTSSSEVQALNEFITAHSESSQCGTEKRYEYDPINDHMQLVTQGVGKGKPQDSTSTGKLVMHIDELNTYSVSYYINTTLLITPDITKQYISPLFIGTEPTSVAAPDSDNSLPLISPTPPPTPTPTSKSSSYEPAMPTASEVVPEQLHAATSRASTATSNKTGQGNPIPGPSNVSRKADNQHERQQGGTSESETSPSMEVIETGTANISDDQQNAPNSDMTSVSDEFSEEDASPVPNTSQDSSTQKDRPLHERIDTRIQTQKDERWKGNGTWKGKIGKMEDPRPSAIIPIHAPQMERMTKARLQALKQRAMTAEVSRKEGLVDGIMYEMEKLHDINYSMTTIGAEIVTEAEMLPAKTVVTATNDPNTTRPRPPKMKFSREQKGFLFPNGDDRPYSRSSRAIIGYLTQVTFVPMQAGQQIRTRKLPLFLRRRLKSSERSRQSESRRAKLRPRLPRPRG